MTHNGRRDPFAGLDDTLELLMSNGKKTTRDRTWEHEQRTAPDVCQVSYRNIPRDLKNRIKAIASSHQVTTDQVARKFLEHALQEYEAGNLSIETKTAAVRTIVDFGDP